MSNTVYLKKIFLTSLCVFSLVCISAQETSTPKPTVELAVETKPDGPITRFGIQVQASLNYLSPSTTGFSNEGVRMSIQPTFHADFKVHENIRLSLGLRYGSRNGHLRFTDANAETIGNDVIRTYVMRSLDIPFAVKANTNEFKSWSFFGSFGFTPSFVLTAKAIDLYEDLALALSPSLEPMEGDFIRRSDIRKQVQTFDVAASVQIGFEYRFGRSTALSMHLGSDIWLLNTLSKRHYNVSGTHPIAHVRQFYIGVGIIF